MIYLDPKTSENGAYPNLKRQPFPECTPVSDEYLQTIIRYNGFVTVSEDGAVTPNTESWEAWKAEQPEPTPPEPTDTDVLNALLGVTV